MDTIIYLSLVRSSNAGGLKESPAFSIREKKGKYLLLNIGIPKEMLDFAKENEKENKPPAGKGDGWKRQIKRLLPDSVAEYFLKKHQIKEQQVKRMDYGQKLEKVLGELFWEVKPYLEESYDCCCVYDDSLEKWLGRQEQDFKDVWNRLWPYPELEDYREVWFIEELLEQCHLAHYVILGFDSCLPPLLIQRARQMKSLRFYVDDLTENDKWMLDEFLEDFYEDYGLAAGVKEMEHKAGLACTVPSKILDFSGEARILSSDVAKGSIWLDMDSMEEKRRRLEDRNTGIAYYSMKKLWKQAGMEKGRGRW